MLPAAAALAGVAIAALAAWQLSCGGDSSAPPSSDTTTTTTTITTSPPTTVAASCPLGKGTFYADVDVCDREGSELRPQLEAAMDRLIVAKPTLFDLTNEYAPGTRAYKVLDKEGYMDGLVAELVSAGLCSERDVDDVQQETIRAKRSNDFSEDFDVLLKGGHMRRGPGTYLRTCRPPNFPADRPKSVPPLGSGCYRPFPPPLYKVNCRDYLNAGDHHVMDSTPIVADPVYCEKIGLPGRIQCPVRADVASDRVACENWRMGVAKDTGRAGPTWTHRDDGSYCTDIESGCVNSPDSQYQLWVYRAGWYRACPSKGTATCCDYQVDR